MEKTLAAPYDRKATTDSITMVDLFAGAGGLTNGFYSASERFVTTRAVELDKDAAATFATTFGNKVYAGSVTDWPLEETVPEVDVVVGGPPCQGFSLLGKRDANDERNFLWREYAHVLKLSRPKYFVLENVPAFAKSQQLVDLTASTRPGGDLEDFDFEWRILNAADYGAPQARKRAIVLGWRRDVEAPKFPAPTHAGKHASVRSAFQGIPAEVAGIDLPARASTSTGREARGPFRTTELHLGRRYAPISLARFDAIPPGGSRRDLPESLQARCWIGHHSGAGDVMGRLYWDKPSVTIRTEFFKPEKGRYLHPIAPRAITHLEAARLQGFTDEHLWVGSKTSIAKQIGNAVPRWLGEAVAREILKVA
ncbi:DNA cytosine methyltransferase [Arthrobacter sp. VKM Ac-2550]|uniref:DNA cytosine methyltransferase n=1 Tax=Crystallibacter permensis TaxID=1938888 RepID=UPI0022273D2E|nr:DNA cytosine methyltransferase [Arthrobacter sp. VKM Ac-2550]MCW2135104.1 DNA (cytosine-5)-methyltransferase 1 [Arthrobacter sp. VKM Ac-2550]